jgi:hypothetical protein
MRVGRQAIQRIALPLGFVHTLQRASAGGVPAAHRAGSSPASAPLGRAAANPPRGKGEYRYGQGRLAWERLG